MPPDSFLHERSDFKALVETVADSEKINDPALVEKDYWIMHAIFGLKQLGLTFELKGSTSLSKGFGVIHRFSDGPPADGSGSWSSYVGCLDAQELSGRLNLYPTTGGGLGEAP